MTAEGSEPFPNPELQESLGPRYQLTREIGRGGMAVVYLATDRQMDRSVAVKVLHSELLETAAAERFLREIRSVSRLQHPHILPIFDWGQAKGRLWYSMPFVEGESLRDRITREGPLPFDDCLRIAKDVTDALSRAHQEGLVHRDIKPENILLSNNHAVVADFGVAKALEESGSETLTKTGITLGTPAYMSPEQASGSQKIDQRSDLYSLGCVLYEMIAGEPPFTGPDPWAILAKHRNQLVPSLEVVRPDVSVELMELVEKTLAKLPADRFASANQLSEALDLAAVAPALTRAKGRTFERGARKSLPVGRDRRGPAAWWLVGAAVAISVVGVVARKLIPTATPTLDQNKVVVFPLFDQRPEVAEGIAIPPLIESALENIPPLKCIDGWTRLPVELRQDIVSLAPGQARAISETQGAGLFLMGTVFTAGDSLAVSLRLYDTAQDTLIDQRTAYGPVGERSAGALALRALAGIVPPLRGSGQEVDLAYLQERDPRAVALWTEGTKAYQLARFEESYELLKQAIERDSLLVSAALKGVMAAGWTHAHAGADSLLRRAIAHDSLLSVQERHLARGLLAYFGGQADSAVVHIRRAQGADPDWAEAWTALGEVYFHLFPQGARVPDAARKALEESLERDPEFLPPLLHLAEIALSRGEMARAEEYLSRVRRSEDQLDHIVRLERAVACAQQEFSLEEWRTAAALDPVEALMAGKFLAVGAEHPVCAERAFRAVLDQGGIDSGTQWGALLGLFCILAATGQDGAVADLLDGAQERGWPGVAHLRLLRPLVGLRPGPGDSTLVRSVLDNAGPDYERIGARSGWAVGLWEASQGRLDPLRGIAASLDRRRGDAGDRNFTLMSRAVDAHLARLEGRDRDALLLFGELYPNAPLELIDWDHWESLGVERIAYARLLLESSRPEEALAVASGIDHPAPLSFVAFVPESLVIRVEAAEALGLAAEAAGYRERLIKIGRMDLLEGPS